MDKICGNYKHYKGFKYKVYCDATDKNGEKYVVYQQLYGNKAFWIRPYEMFFEQVSIVGENGTAEMQPRFKTSGKVHEPDEEIENLIKLIKKDQVVLKHSETEEQYVITSISKINVIVQPYSLKKNGYEGYLTEYELIRRLGKNCCLIDNKLEVWDSEQQYIPQNQLLVEGYDNKMIAAMVNPCSIDVKIAKSGFLRTRRKTVDPESIEHASKASELWSKVKLSKSKTKAGEYFKLRPGETVLSHLENRITLPNDCAGKIEIKSSYARLSLSITSGDFCNPGYDGYFPLELTNHGKHTILIHAGAVMGQLMLIPLNGPVLVEYSKKATQKNKDGYDDGTPYSFWLERSIKKIRKETHDESLIELYKKIRNEIKPDRVDDVNAYKERFDDNFLTFCQNRIHMEKFKSQDNRFPDGKKLLDSYISKEKIWKSLYSIRWVSIVISAVSFIFTAINFFEKWNDKINITFKPWYLIFAIAFAIIFVIFQTKKPKAFCTFEKIDIEKILEETNESTK